MPLCFDPKFIFIHIPKCGGTSIILALHKNKKHLELSFNGKCPAGFEDLYGLWMNHMPASVLKAVIDGKTLARDNEKWEDFFKFAFVRNPWDRMVSTYHYHKVRMNDSTFRQQNPKVVAAFEKAIDFNAWVAAGLYEQPATYYLCDSNDNLLVDFVGKFERLEEHWRTVCNIVGLDYVLPHERATKHDVYMSYYDKQSIDAVAQHFAKDIERFDYKFGEK